jgi:hypothetical protein
MQPCLRRSTCGGNVLAPEWLLLKREAHFLEKDLRDAGWHFFWISGEVQGWAVTWDQEAAFTTALCKALRKVERRFNAAEIIRGEHRAFLGAHFCRFRIAMRHIQQEPVLTLTRSVELVSPALPSPGLVTMNAESPEKAAA